MQFALCSFLSSTGPGCSTSWKTVWRCRRCSSGVAPVTMRSQLGFLSPVHRQGVEGSTETSLKHTVRTTPTTTRLVQTHSFSRCVNVFRELPTMDESSRRTVHVDVNGAAKRRRLRRLRSWWRDEQQTVAAVTPAGLGLCAPPSRQSARAWGSRRRRSASVTAGSPVRPSSFTTPLTISGSRTRTSSWLRI